MNDFPVELTLSAMATATIGESAAIPAAFVSGLPAGLPANTVKIILIPRGDVYWNIGVASEDTAKVPAGGISFPVTKTVADAIQLFADDVACDILVFVPRS